MRPLLALLLLLVLAPVADAEAPWRPTRQAIADTGAAFYAFGTPPAFDVQPSPDGSRVHQSQWVHNGIPFGLILVQLAEDPGTPEQQETLLGAYLDHVAGQALGLKPGLDPGLGHRLDSTPQARGILLYGDDAQGRTTALKGWIAGRMLAVLHVGDIEALPSYNIVQLYLDGFRFPAP